MSTSSPDETPPPAELEGLDPKDLLQAALETVPPVTLPLQSVDPDVTVRVASPGSSQPSASQAELPLPEELTNLLPHGNYSVESFLGQGGMGAVYKGMQVRLKRPVAIKIMRRDQGKDYGFEQRFEREAQAMAKLNHPNIVSVIDYGEAGADYLYIVMELIDGADLMDVIRTGRMTQEMALTLLPQVCDALQFAHDHGIVHRDIKPSNIMLTRDGRVKMCDFGLAKPMDAMEHSFRTQTGTGMGTPDYAAPEQFDAHAHIDHRADIYALGVMIYQMITGTLPRGVWKPPSQRAEIDPQWDDIVSRAMQSDPGDRYQQASEVKTDVSQITPQGRAAAPSAAANVPAVANRPREALAGASALPKSKSRSPFLFGLIIGAVVIVLGVFFALKKPDQSGPRTPVSGTSDAKAPAAPPQVVTSAKPTATVSPAPSLPVTKSPIAAPALPESGWKPLASKEEWETNWEGTPFDYGGKLVLPNRRFNKEGLLHMQSTSLYKPSPSADGAIRVESVIRQLPHVINLGVRRRSGDQGRYAFGMGKDGNSLLIRYITTDAATWGTLQSCPLPTPLKIGDHLKLELRIQGSQITGLCNGVAVLQAQDQRLTAAGEWGLDVVDASIQSVEVQPLPAGAVSHSPSPLVSKSSATTSTPAWNDWIEEKRRAGAFSNHPQLRDEPTGLRITADPSAELFIGPVFRNGRVRVSCVVPESGGEVPLFLRNKSEAGNTSRYKVAVSKKSGIKIQLSQSSSGEKMEWTILKSWPLPKDFDWAREYALELAAMNDLLTVSLNGKEVGSVQDTKLTGAGSFGFSALKGTRITKVEYQSLDGSTAAAVSPSPKLSSSASATKFPPGQWVNPFADLSKLPGLADFKDGWARLGGNNSYTPLGELDGKVPAFRNAAIRLRRKDASGLYGPQLALRYANGRYISLQYYPPSGTRKSAAVQLREYHPELAAKGATAAQAWAANLLLVEKEIPPIGKEYTAELTSVGSTVVGRINDVTVTCSVDDGEKSGQLAMAGTFRDPFRDIEVINLDGVPEAEALKIAGVDEKGNDLRGKSGAVSPSPSLPISSSSVATATKDAPFTNSLGMKFVPVPIGGGPTKGERVLFGVWVTRVQDYAAYAKAQEAAGKKVDGSWKTEAKDGVPVGRELDHPVVGVSWKDADAFCQWLTAKETAEGKLPQGMKYRLPSDEEWNWAVGLPLEQSAVPEKRNGNNTVDFPWGKNWPPTKMAGNYADESFHAMFPPNENAKEDGRKNRWIEGYTDGYATTSPVGSFPANAHGLYDMGGNVYQWCEDWWNNDQKDRLLRGASWNYGDRGLLLSSRRTHTHPDTRVTYYGFRVVVADVSAPVSSAVSPSPNLPVPARNASRSDAGGSKSSDPKFPPGQWVKLFTKPEELHADLRKPGSVVTWEDGWIRFDRNASGRPRIDLPSGVPGMTNYAIRVRGIRSKDEISQTAIVLRKHETKFQQYQLSPKGVFLTINRRDGEDYPEIMRFSKPIVQSGSEYVMEFGIVGSQLVARYNDDFMRVQDTTFKQGSAYLSGKDDLSNIEVINLDGLPEAEALRLLGVDEKGNDLRGKGGVAGSPPAANGPAGSKSPVAEQKAPGIPAGDWVSMVGKIHPVTNAVSGVWSLTAEGLFSKGGGTNGYNVLQPPYDPPEEYDFRVSFSAQSGRAEIHQIIVAAGREFVWSNAGGADPGARFSGSGEAASELVEVPEPLAGRRHESLIEVRRDRLTGYLDGKRVVEWKPDFARLPQTTQSRLAQLGRIGVACWSNGTTFHDISLRQIAAIAKPPVDSSSSVAIATKDAPFINSLGMKFVPVPITGGPTDKQRLLFSTWETRVQDYEVFVKETKRKWVKPDFEQAPTHPAVMVSWEDAQAFCTWLTEKERKAGKVTDKEVYRLPSDHEWSCALGIGEREDAAMLPGEKNQKLRDVFPWGSAWPPPPGAGHLPGEEVSGHEINEGQKPIPGYRDAFIGTAPVASFPPNHLALYDLGGNAREMCEDWYDATQKNRALRGGSYHNYDRPSLLSSYRRSLHASHWKLL